MSTGSVERERRRRGRAEHPGLPQIVLCDDETSMRRLYRRALRSCDVDVIDAVDAEECLTSVEELLPDLLVLDLTLPGRSGLEILAEIRALSPDTRVMIVSGLVTSEVEQHALDLGAAACVLKTDFLPRLRAMVSEIER